MILITFKNKQKARARTDPVSTGSILHVPEIEFLFFYLIESTQMTTQSIENTTNLPLDLCKIISHLSKEPTKNDLILTIKSQFPSITHPTDFFSILGMQCRMVVLYCTDCKKNICVWTSQDNRMASLLPIHIYKGCDLEKCNCMIVYKNKSSTIKKIPIVLIQR